MASHQTLNVTTGLAAAAESLLESVLFLSSPWLLRTLTSVPLCKMGHMMLPFDGQFLHPANFKLLIGASVIKRNGICYLSIAHRVSVYTALSPSSSLSPRLFRICLQA